MNRQVNHSLQYFIIAVILIFTISCRDHEFQKIDHTQTPDIEKKFAGKETCKKCHPEEYAQWQGSDHDLSMQIANEQTVLGNFNNVIFKSKGITYKFLKKGEDYLVNTEGDDGQYHDFKIANTFGVRPLQQYLVDFPGGRKQCLTVAWDTRRNRWFDIQPEDSVHPGEWMHWTGGSMTWNNMCADCHSTDLHKNYDPATDTYHTTYSEINVSCEACHGPASQHVAYYRNPGKYKTAKPPALYMTKKTTAHELVDKCARCHARRSQLTPYFDYTGHFLDHYKPALISPPEYEADGQIKDEDYVYASFIQSKMYHHGVSCRDCHNMHTLKLKKQGNKLCLQCHESTYNNPAHHFHKQGTAASQCINCHMTGRYYMGIDFRRDHSFRIPRPDQSEKYGTPNACTGCHEDKSNRWASQVIENHFGKNRQDHFSNDMLKGYFTNPDYFLEVVRQKKYPAISRATALSHFAGINLTDDDIRTVISYLKDSSALVRNEAITGLDKYTAPAIIDKINNLLNDSIRLVRISAARYLQLHNLPVDTNSTAYKEYLTELKTNADFASGQHQLALFYQSKGQIDKAIFAYEKALKIDNYFNMSRINLALLYYQKGNINKAEKLYQTVIKQEPAYSYPYFMLGLLYNETGDKAKAMKYLATACDKQPPVSRAFYNYALMLQAAHKDKQSVEVLQKALQIFPGNENLLYVKLLGEKNAGFNDQALKTCRLLLQINPDNQTYQKIYHDLQNK